MANDEKKGMSVAASLGPDFQVESLKAAGSIHETFQKAASQEPTTQVEAMEQGDQEKAQSGDGSKMISEEGSRHNMNPPEGMRKDVDAAAFDGNIIADGLREDFNRAKDDLYKDAKASDFNIDSFIESAVQDPELDKKHENTSDYENDM